MTIDGIVVTMIAGIVVMTTDAISGIHGRMMTSVAVGARATAPAIASGAAAARTGQGRTIARKIAVTTRAVPSPARAKS